MAKEKKIVELEIKISSHHQLLSYLEEQLNQLKKELKIKVCDHQYIREELNEKIKKAEDHHLKDHEDFRK